MTQTAKKSPFSMNVDLMHGPIFKNLLLFMLPIFISSLFQQLYNTVDTMIVGNVLGFCDGTGGYQPSSAQQSVSYVSAHDNYTLLPTFSAI